MLGIKFDCLWTFLQYLLHALFDQRAAGRELAPAEKHQDAFGPTRFGADGSSGRGEDSNDADCNQPRDALERLV